MVESPSNNLWWKYIPTSWPSIFPPSIVGVMNTPLVSTSNKEADPIADKMTAKKESYPKPASLASDRCSLSTIKIAKDTSASKICKESWTKFVHRARSCNFLKKVIKIKMERSTSTNLQMWFYLLIWRSKDCNDLIFLLIQIWLLYIVVAPRNCNYFWWRINTTL